MHDVYPLLEHSDFPLIKRGSLTTVQVNLGYKCNQSCTHCHVNAGPKRKEEMSKSVMIDILKFIDRFSIVNIDLTGGAPELNKNFPERRLNLENLRPLLAGRSPVAPRLPAGGRTAKKVSQFWRQIGGTWRQFS